MRARLPLVTLLAFVACGDPTGPTATWGHRLTLQLERTGGGSETSGTFQLLSSPSGKLTVRGWLVTGSMNPLLEARGKLRDSTYVITIRRAPLPSEWTEIPAEAGWLYSVAVGTPPAAARQGSWRRGRECHARATAA